MTIDGRVEVTLRDAGDGRIAVIASDDGELSGPDLWVEIILVDESAPAADGEAPLSEEVAQSG
jgi:hypothetical protein